MTPSHSRKKGVRYRYYVSQAILQSRKGQAGQVFRVPAPDIEALVERLVRDRCRDPRGDIRPLVEAQVQRITVLADSISVEMIHPGGHPASAEAQSRQMVRLPWLKKPFRAEKGITSAPAPAQETGAGSRDAVLAMVARARCWVDQLMAGAHLAEIAKQERKGERQIRLLIPLAFLPPGHVRKLIAGGLTKSVTEMARNMPLVWS